VEINKEEEEVWYLDDLAELGNVCDGHPIHLGWDKGWVFRVSGFGFRVTGYGFQVSSFGFCVSGFGFRVSDFGLRVDVSVVAILTGQLLAFTEVSSKATGVPRS